MTKKELREQLRQGKLMSDLFDFTYGQECDIYKGTWQVSDEIIYIPDIYLNEIASYDYKRESWYVISDEDIEEIINWTYTGKDFMELTDGDEELAKRLFYYVDWQHPSSALNEVLDNDEQDYEYERDGKTEMNFYPELEKYDEDHCYSIIDSERKEDGQFEIIFEADEERYYCYITATSMTEALGIFFILHPHITYEMITDHMEV